MKPGREWTPAVVVQQHQAPCSYIVATPEGTQMRRNRFHLQPTKEEVYPSPSPAGEAVASDKSNPCMLMLVWKRPGWNHSPIGQQANQPVRNSLRFRRRPQRLEPMTFAVPVQRSNQLSYQTNWDLVTCKFLADN